MGKGEGGWEVVPRGRGGSGGIVSGGVEWGGLWKMGFGGYEDWMR